MRIALQPNRVATRALWAAIVAAACLAAALAASLPAALALSGAIPMGTEREATVPLSNIWSLWWTADRAAHGFANYWDAPIFYPNQGVFTYSEPQPLIGLLVAPLWGLGAPPALIYNLALLALLALNCVFAYRLTRALDVPVLPALLAGILTATLPFVAKILGVLQLTALFGMLWTLEGLVRFGRTGRPRWAVWAATGFVATYLTCQQYALIFAPFAAAAGLVALAQQGFRVRAVALLVGAGVAAGALVLLIAQPALRVHSQLGFQRLDPVVQALSARPGDFLTRPDTALVPLPPGAAGDTAGLFPGLILAALALVGAVMGARDPGRRGWTIYLAASALAALLLALGLNLNLAGWRPFATLRAVVPGLGELRSPFRFAAIAQLCLPILAAVALVHVGQARARGGAVVILLLGLLGAGENLAPGRLAQVPASPRTAWTSWLRAQPDTAVVAHVPFPGWLHTAAYEIEAARMFAQIDHHKPIVNGYSSYFPQARTPEGAIVPTYTEFQLAMAQRFPDYNLLCVLTSSLGANTLVVDTAWLADHEAQLEAQGAFLRAAYADEQVRIYHMQAPTGECQPR